MRQDIGSDIYLHAILMGKTDSLLHILFGKILGLRPQAKGFSSNVYRIRSENNRGLKYLKITGRNQKLRFSVFFTHTVLIPFRYSSSPDIQTAAHDPQNAGRSTISSLQA